MHKGRRAVTGLGGKRVLVVEDEVLVATMLEDMLSQLGADVVGPAYTIASALALAGEEVFDCALLDVNLRGERIDPVTGILDRRGIPYALATGYSGSILEPWPQAPIVAKPYFARQVEEVLELLVSRAPA